jgi:hypothetical protein
MTTPAAFTEAWANPAAVPCTVASGYNPGGAAGDSETWVMAGGWAQFPAADDSIIPPSLFRVFDPAAPAEHFQVHMTMGGTWLIYRGDQGTPVVAHAPGFEVRSLLSPAGLGALARGVPSGNGLLLPAAGRTGNVADWNDDLRHPIATLQVPGGEAADGAVYEVFAWGVYGSRAGQNSGLFFGLSWGAAALGPDGFVFVPGQGINAPSVRWKVHSIVSVYAGRAHANSTVWMATRNDVDLLQYPLHRFMFGDTAAAGTAITTATGQAFAAYIQGANNVGTLPGGMVISLFGSKIWRSA